MTTKWREELRAKWLLVYREFESLGMTVREFSAARGVNYYTFKGWNTRFRKEKLLAAAAESPAGETFREISVVSGESRYTITLRGGRTLSIEDGFAESRLRKLIEILESC